MSLYRLGEHSPQMPASGDFWVAPDANVIGNVILEDACSIWFGVTIRGDNEPIIIGQGSNIQENCVLHTDIGSPLAIGQNCTIGHKAMLHGCTIGDGALVGMGATILNNAVIGKGCLIGAGALVTEGKVIPDGTMVLGAPGKVARDLSADEVQGLLASAEAYRANMRRFRETLDPL